MEWNHELWGKILNSEYLKIYMIVREYSAENICIQFKGETLTYGQNQTRKTYINRGEMKRGERRLLESICMILSYFA